MQENFVLGQGENVSVIEEVITLPLAEGLVEPAPRIAQGEIDAGTVNELSERLKTDEFYDSIDPLSIPTECMECRLFQHEQQAGAKAAGGSFALVLADALTNNSYRQKGETAPVHARRLYGELKKAGYPVGTHNAEGAQDNNCGCGAEDKLDSPDPNAPSTLRFIEKHIDELSLLAVEAGYIVTNELKARLVQNAANLRKEGYATSGKELSQACQEAAGPTSVATVVGSPKGVIFAINAQHGTTLNREKVEEAYGQDYQVYSIDLPSFRNGAEAISITEQEADDKEVAMFIATIAAGHQVVGPSIKVVVR